MNIEYVMVNDEGVVQVPLNSSVAEINGAIRKHVSSTHGCEAHCIVLEKIPNKSPMYLVLIDQGLQSFRQNGCTVDVVDGQPLTDAQKAQVQKEIREWIIRKQIRVLDLTDLYVYFGIAKMIPDAFDQCASLTSLILPDGLVAIGEGAFDHCTALTTVAMPASVTTIGEGAFDHCTALTHGCNASQCDDDRCICFLELHLVDHGCNASRPRDDRCICFRRLHLVGKDRITRRPRDDR